MIGFIIVTYKTARKEILRLRREIDAIGLSQYRIYVIDNTKENKGYGEGVNEGIRRAIKDNCRLFIILNPDLSLKKINKKALLGAEEQFDVWGGAMIQQGKVYYGGKIDPWRMSGGLITTKPKKRFVEVDFVSGSLMIIKKEVIDKIGFFDPRYFMYYEDVDFCYRARQFGFKIGVDQLIKYPHFESGKSENKDFYLRRGRNLFFKKYGNFTQRVREMIRIPKTLWEEKKSFLFNFFSLNLSSFLVKLLSFALFFFLIRRLSPSEYGIYILVWAQVNLLSPLLDLGTTSYGIVYLSGRSKKELYSLFSLRFFLGILTFVLTIGLAFLFGYQTSVLRYIFLASLVIFYNVFSGSFLIFNSLKNKVFLSSLFSLVNNLILNLGLIAIVLAGRKLMTIFLFLFLFYLLGALVYFYANIVSLKEKVGEGLRLLLDWDYSSWIKIVKKSYVFVLISLFAGLYYKGDIFLLNFMKGSGAVGIYSAGHKFLDALMFIAASYNVAATPILARLKRVNRDLFLEKIKNDLRLLIFIGGGTVLCFYLLGPLFLPFVLKGKYLLAIPVLNTVILALPLILITSVFLNSLYILGKAHWAAVVFLFQVLFNLGLNVIFIPRYSYLASARITLLTEILNVIIFFFLFKKSFHSGVNTINVDGGGLGAEKTKRYGNYVFSRSLLRALRLHDKKNKYKVYTFSPPKEKKLFGENVYLNVLRPRRGWLKWRLSWEQFIHPGRAFLALNQALPFYVGGKIIAFSHGLSFLFYPQYYPDSHLKMHRQVDEMVRRADHIIVSSKKVRDDFYQIYGKLNKIVVLPFGVTIPKKRNKKPPQALTRYLNKNFFLYVGMDHPIKNIDFIVRSFLRFKAQKSMKKVYLYLIGVNKKYEQQGENIIVFNFIDHSLLNFFYQKSQALLTSSFYESFNLPVLENLSLKGQVIGLRTAIIPELAKYVFLCKNEKDFVAAMESVSWGKRKEIDLEELRSEFSWQKYVKKLTNLINNEKGD